MPLVGGATGTFTVTAGSLSSIVVSGTMAQVPQWILLWTFGVNGTGTGTGDLMTGFGITDGTRQGAVANWWDDAAATPAGKNCITNSNVLLEISSSAITGKLQFSSFDGAAGTGGFTLACNDAWVNTTTVYYLCGWGFTNAYVAFDQRAGTTGNKSKTLVGFQGNAGLFIGSQTPSLDTVGAVGRIALGVATSSSARASLGVSYRASTTNYTWGMINTAHCLSWPSATNGAMADSADFVSWDADGYTINQDLGTSQYQFLVLVLSAPVVAVVETALQGSTGVFTVTAAGSEPGVAIGLCNFLSAATQTTGNEGAAVGWGALARGGHQLSAFQYNANRETVSGGQVTEEYSVGATTSFLAGSTRSGADTLAADSVLTESRMYANAIELNQTDAPATINALVALLVCGNVSGSGLMLAGERNFLVR